LVTSTVAPSTEIEPPVVGRPTGLPRRTLAFAAGAVAAVVIVVVVIVLVSGSGGSGSGGALAAGSATGTITVVSPPHGTATFSGTIDGKPLTGSISAPSGSSSVTPVGDTFTYSGRYDGTPYTLHVSLHVPNGQPSVGGGIPAITFSVTGSYGSAPVSASAQFDVSSVTAHSLPVVFSGHVGSKMLTGTATARPGPSHTTHITASFVVS
jgi:hypothetical protein